jgi:hypothetical protein
VIWGKCWELTGASIYSFKHRTEAEFMPKTSYITFGKTAQLSDLVVTEAMLLGNLEYLESQIFSVANSNCNLVNQNNLIQEPRVNHCGSKNLLGRSAFEKRLLHIDDSSIRWLLD